MTTDGRQNGVQKEGPAPYAFSLRPPVDFSLLSSDASGHHRLLLAPVRSPRNREHAEEEIEGKLQALVGDLKARLSLPAPVVVSIVPSNALMMSSKRHREDSQPFLLKVDASFLDTLTDGRDLKRPLHTSSDMSGSSPIIRICRPKSSPNQIAMRAVSRDSLERLYAKVWQRGGMKGDLARFLGDRPAAAAGLGLGQSDPDSPVRSAVHSLRLV